MNITLKAALSAILLSALALPAAAADLPSTKAPLAPALAYSQSPWMIRVRALGVMPEQKATLTGVPVGYGVSVTNSLVPELDISYFLTKNIALELILGVTPHEIKGKGTIAALGDIVATTALPPTLTLQYHFTDFGAFKPYIGIGVNYTTYFNTTVKNPGAAPASIKPSWGIAGQIGFDYMFDQHWGFNVDVKKILMEPSVSLAGGAVTGKVNLNPWLIGAGVTYRF